MAWLSGLADKAENLLNKIDQNTAAVLNKDKYDVPLPRVPEGTWVQNGFTHDTTDIASTQTTLHCASVQQTADLETSVPTHEQWEKISEDRCCPSSLPDHPNIFLRGKEEGEFTDDPFMEEKDNIIEIQHKHKFKEQEEDNATIMPFTTSSVHKSKQKTSVAIETELEEQNIASGTRETDHQKQIMCLKEQLTAVEIEKAQLSTRITDLMSMLERSRLEVSTMQSELELHRARALKTLREKEKLITELRRNTPKNTDDIIVMELNQIRQEREVLREENQLICEQLRIAREDLITADLKLETMKHKIKEAGIQAQDVLAVEKRKRLDAEEDARLHSEEIRSLKEELIRQRNNFTLQLRKQESELSRLRIQLSATTTPSSEVESRLATLTQTLVLKQQALEHLTTERNALRLQMEKIEHEYRNYVGNSRRNVPYNNGNDTDDAKAQIPLFLIETPFDTSVTRRVKRAYSSLDAISIRTGVFLRRYPLARILVLIYMALLQFWVLIVLLSQSPDAH